MKVTRVLLAANDNPIYYQFWNPLSQVYAEKFKIEPTLILMGEPEDIERLGLSQQFGEIIVQQPHPGHHLGWQSAWAIFWFMKMFPEDVFCTMGIDQIPLSPMLISDVPANYSNETYLMLVDDGYLPSHWEDEEGTSPTSYHIMKGSIANDVYRFEESFHDEIDKIADAGIKPYYDGVNKWGLDESYSSHKLRQYRELGGKIISSRFFKQVCEKRIECCRTNEPVYDLSFLRDGLYGDAHFCRPFNDHKDYIEQILKNIP